MSEFDIVLNSNTEAPLALHIFVVIFFMITGGIYNGIIIFIKGKKSSLQETEYYVIALACVDIFVCLVICPQYPLLTLFISEYKNKRRFLLIKHLICAVIATFVYLQLLTTIALYRAYSVYRPFAFTSSAKRSFCLISIIFIVSITGAITISILLLFDLMSTTMANTILVCDILFCFIVQSVSYIFIARKLFRQKRKIASVVVMSKSQSNIFVTSAALVEHPVAAQIKHVNTSGVIKARERQIKTVTMFGIITLVFLILFSPGIILSLELTKH